MGVPPNHGEAAAQPAPPVPFRCGFSVQPQGRQHGHRLHLRRRVHDAVDPVRRLQARLGRDERSRTRTHERRLQPSRRPDDGRAELRRGPQYPPGGVAHRFDRARRGGGRTEFGDQRADERGAERVRAHPRGRSRHLRIQSRSERRGLPRRPIPAGRPAFLRFVSADRGTHRFDEGRRPREWNDPC